jgi:hypothetical protein
MNNIFIIIVLTISGIYLLTKPELLLILFFTLTIAAVNFDIPGTVIKFRPILAGVLIFQSFINPTMKLPEYPFRRNAFVLVLFFLYCIFLSWGMETFTVDIAKSLLLSVVSAYLGFYAFKLKNNASIIFISIVLAGFICVADVLYTYIVIGNFPVQRIFNLLLPDTDYLESINDTNHNFYGFICGIGFLLLINEGIKDQFKYPLKYWVSLPLLLLGVLMSTSRSALFGVTMAIFGLSWFYFRKPAYRKLMSGLLIKGVAAVGMAVVAFILIQSVLNLDNSFTDNIYFRLIEEPLAMIRKYTGQQYDIQQLDAMDWRTESAAIAWQVYLHLPPWKQLFGVGIGGYLQNNLGHNELNPHNGYLYILIESGLIGSILYFSLLGIMIRDALRKNVLSSLIIVLLFIMFYAAGQNDELITASAMITISSLIAENSLQHKSTPSEININKKSLAYGIKGF